jgi:hypothetical protein
MPETNEPEIESIAEIVYETPLTAILATVLVGMALGFAIYYFYSVGQKNNDRTRKGD